MQFIFFLHPDGFMKLLLQTIFLFCVLLGHVGLGAATGPQISGPARVELISDVTQVAPGEAFYLALHFELEPHWHIYWKNSGASGLPVEIDWELPEGLIAEEIQWPAPQRIELGGLMSYGFENTVSLLVPVRASSSLELGMPLSIRADVFWLVCKEECLPGDASLTLDLVSGEKSVISESTSLFDAARERLPKPTTPWKVSGMVEDETLILTIEQAGEKPLPGELYFYADTGGVIDPNAVQDLSFKGEGLAELKAPLAIEQSEQSLKSFSGVLQSASESWELNGLVGVKADQDNSVMTAQQTSQGFEGFLLKLGLPGQLLLAFIGGLILNLMPCVLPVLSLKVFSLLKHSGQSRSKALLHGGAYAVGVVSSFLALAGLLLFIRSLGQQIGWGFQLQSPVFVAVLTVLIFLFALNLMGVFELGTSLIGADAVVSQRRDSLGSFGMGVLAAVVGAPCIGPFLATVSGIALQADPLICLLIFGIMGFGLASPFLLISIFPKLSAYLPKPGAWMESLKQFMGFLLMATTVFLIYVVGTLGGAEAIVRLLTSLLIVSIAAWVYGRWSVPIRSKRTRRIAMSVSFLLLLGGLAFAISGVRKAHQQMVANASDVSKNGNDGWVAWSAESVESALANKQAVFIDFTASWCLICQLNKKVALRTEATEALFEDYGVVTMAADWTSYDPDITKELERFGRSGVPLYVLYAPDGSTTVLPQNLTHSKIREAIETSL